MNQSISKLDFLIAFVLLTLTAFVCLRASRWDSAAYHAPSAQDIWFDADTRRVFWIETDRDAKNDRASLHPFQRLVSYPPVFVLRRLGLSSERAVQTFHSAIGALWVGGFFLLLRRLGSRRGDALAFTGVAATSAAGLFWLPVTESFVFGSLSMFPALALAARPETATARRHFFSTFLSLGMTLTNGMVGLFSALVSLSRKRFAAVCAAALAAAALCVLMDGALFPGTRILPGEPMDEAAWVFSPESGGPFAILRGFFVSGMVAPELRFLDNWKHPVWPVLTFQFGGLFSAGPWSWAATISWILLLAMGLGVLLKSRERTVLRSLLVLSILYQLLLHLVYGRELFLYAIHFTPLMVLVAAFAAQSRWRPAALALCAVLTVSNLANNLPVYKWARDYTTRHAPLKKLEGITHQRVEGSSPPALTYRFWKDGLGRNEGRSDKRDRP